MINTPSSLTNTNSARSIVKSEWCSNLPPPLSIELPTLIHQSNNFLVMWSVVRLNDIFQLIDQTQSSELAGIYNSSDLPSNEYERRALNITIQADTIILEKNVTVFNLKHLSFIARKLIIEENVTLQFKQVTSIPVWWPNLSAPFPDLNETNGIHGQNGSNGFNGTNISIDVGCINNNEKTARIEVYSGKVST